MFFHIMVIFDLIKWLFIFISYYLIRSVLNNAQFDAFLQIKQGNLLRSILLRVSHICPVSWWTYWILVRIAWGSSSVSTDPPGLQIASSLNFLEIKPQKRALKFYLLDRGRRPFCEFSFSSSFSQDGTFSNYGIYFQSLEMWESNNICRENVCNQSSLLKYLVLTILIFEIVCHRKEISLKSVIHPKY